MAKRKGRKSRKEERKRRVKEETGHCSNLDSAI